MLKLTASWFYERQFATVTGIMVALGNFGSISSAAPLAWIVESVSWRNVFVATGIFSIVLAVLIWLLVRDTPQELNFSSMRELEGKEDHQARKEHWRPALFAVLKNRYTWPGFWVTLGCAGVLLSFAGLWGVPYLMNVYGMNRITAAYHTSLMLFGFASGSLTMGVLSDRIGKRKTLLIGALFMYSVCWLLWFFFKLSEPFTYLLCLVTGLTASGFTLCWTCAKEVNQPAVSGMATSVVNTGIFLGVGLLQPLVGWAIDLDGYDSVVKVMLVFVCFGLACTFFIKETYCKNITLGTDFK
jgi:sugar phosphate permease